MSAYYNDTNYDKVVIRDCVIGLLHELSNKIYYRQFYDNQEHIVNVPFYYSFVGSEQYIDDHYYDVDDQNYIKGNYDKVPRGVFQLKSFQIESDSLKHKFIRGSYKRKDDKGNVNSYTAQFQYLPLVVNSSLEIIATNQIEVFKIIQAVLKNIYKSHKASVETGDYETGVFKVQFEFSIDESFESEKDIPIDFTTDKKWMFRVPFVMRMYIPIFETETELFAGTRMFNIEQNTENDYPDDVNDFDIVNDLKNNQ